MRVAIVMGVVALPMTLVVGRWWLRYVNTRGIERRLESLCAQVVGWQAAHDHQVEAIDRRLRDVEASAARAENEARIVSAQLADMNRSLAGRLDQVEHRISRSVAGRGSTCSAMSATEAAGRMAAAGGSTEVGVALGVGA